MYISPIFIIFFYSKVTKTPLIPSIRQRLDFNFRNFLHCVFCQEMEIYGSNFWGFLRFLDCWRVYIVRVCNLAGRVVLMKFMSFFVYSI